MSSPRLVIAFAIGTAQILAACEGQSAGVGIAVNALPPLPVASLSISPATSTLQVSATQQLSATIRNPIGNLLTGRAPVEWLSTEPAVASVSSDGVVTALSVGTTTIDATSDGMAGSATITVTEPTGAGSREPPDMTVITDRPFSAFREAGWPDPMSAYLSIVSDAAAPESPSGTMRMRFPSGYGGGGSPTQLEKGLGRLYSTIYVSYWIKLSSNWYGHPTSGVNKQFHFWINGGNHVFSQAYGGRTGPLKAEIWLQGTAAGERNLSANLGNPGIITRGEWHHWEIVLKCNTNGLANGTIEWWLDGLKIGQYYDVRLEPTLSYWQLVQWSPTWGGTGSTVPADQFESIDHIYISGKN